MLRKASFSDSEKIIIWHNFVLLLGSVFEELFGTNFNPVFSEGIEVGLKRFLIYTLEMLVRALWKQSKLLKQYRGHWGPLWKQSTYKL